MSKPTEQELREQYLKADRAMHVVWTKAVGTEGYDKSEWNRLRSEIEDLHRLGKAALQSNVPVA